MKRNMVNSTMTRCVLLSLAMANFVFFHKLFTSKTGLRAELMWRRTTNALVINNGGSRVLLTPSEMQHVQDNQTDNNGQITGSTYGEALMDKERISSLIRSRLTRPDPSNRNISMNGGNDGRIVAEFSEGGQSKLIDERLNGRRNGFFVECGAHDGETNSNSLFFELHRNWTGLLIEPDPEAYREMLKKNRQAYTLNSCLSLTGQAYESPFVAAGIYGGIRRKMPKRFSKTLSELKVPFKVILATCFSLVDILDVIGVHHVDYLSLDIEGPELEVLETIDWQRIRIDIMTVEIHGDMKKLNDSRRLMKRIGGYREVGLQGLDVVYERTDLGKS